MEMEDTDLDSLNKDVDHNAEVLQTEHLYCRQNINKEHLWQVSNLHSKIQNPSLARLKALEAFISQLWQGNWLFEENVKIIGNCFTTYNVTVI